MSRYIDADKLKQHYAWWGDTKNETAEDTKAIFDSIIDQQPTADVRENVKGEWIEITDKDAPITYACSVCGAGIDYRGFANFCPNCGADMRGEA